MSLLDVDKMIGDQSIAFEKWMQDHTYMRLEIGPNGNLIQPDYPVIRTGKNNIINLSTRPGQGYWVWVLQYSVLRFPVEQFQLGTVTGGISFGENARVFPGMLMTTVGMPSVVLGEFDCKFCPKLDDFTGLPKYVGGTLNLTGCDKFKLSDLNYLPQHVGGDLYLPRIKDWTYEDELHIRETHNIIGRIYYYSDHGKMPLDRCGRRLNIG